jgi:SAM-dependent methyltransferase
MDFSNVYEDDERADAYARLEFPGTYYLAYRDIPGIIADHVDGKRAIDFGCGTGRSTRFLSKLGFDVVGVDISRNMVQKAIEFDKAGDYRVIADGDFSGFEKNSYDLILSAFTFDNIPTREKKVALFGGLASLLNAEGKIINMVSSPEIYTHEWASFTTKDFPENKQAQSGDKVKIIMTDVTDSRPVEDIIWKDDAYREVYDLAGLKVLQKYEPLGLDSEPYDWINEIKIAPWVIYLLGR